MLYINVKEMDELWTSAKSHLKTKSHLSQCSLYTFLGNHISKNVANDTFMLINPGLSYDKGDSFLKLFHSNRKP